MTLNTTYNPTVADGNGTTKEFSYNFNPLAREYLKVSFQINNEWVEQKSGWSATVSENGGVVTFDIAPTTRVAIERNVPEEQPTQYKTSSGFQAEVIEHSFDLLTGMVQELKDETSRSVKVEVGSNISPDEIVSQVERVYDSIDNIDTVGMDIDNVDEVATNISKVNTIANNINDVKTVVDNINDVKTVSKNIENVNTVATDIMDVVTVAGITEQTKNVSDNMTAVVDVSNNKTNINNVSVNMPFVKGVSDNMTHVIAVDRNKANIDNVAANKTNISNVSENITAVNNVSENMTDVKNAVQSANDAKLWAVGTKTEKPEGSSKYWAEQAQQAAQVYDASETVKGIVRLATSDEVTAGTNDSAAITPLKLKSKLDTKQDKSTAVNYNNISNCITEIPQNIVELGGNTSHGTSLVKGIAYIPDGFESDGVTPKFIKDNRTNQTHQNLYQYTSSYMFFVQKGFSGVKYLPVSYCYSGPIAPTEFFISNNQKFALWYDTTNNLVKFTSNGGSTWKSGYSLPIYIATYSDDKSKFTSIDQVFNGFGYIGSTIFALPGVKGLIPNGRNADGSLKNIEFTLDKVLTETFPNLDVPVYVTLKTNSLDYWQVEVTPIAYSETENIFINGYNVKSSELIFGISYLSSGKITSFTPKTVFHALDYNDKSTISGWGMPSSRYIDLTLGANGSTYTAPANGYFYLVKVAGKDNGDIRFTNKTKGIVQEVLPKVSTNWMYVRMEAQKGDVFEIVYGATGDTKKFRFIFAEGEN